MKVTLKNFGRDRRYPITNAFRDSGAPARAADAPAARAKRAAFDG